MDTLRNTKELLYEIVKKDQKRLNPKLVSDNKNLWRTIKPYFSDKGNLSNKIMIS